MKLHLVDGTFELFRAHFSPRPERPFKATAGLVSSLVSLLHDPAEAVTHLAIAFDNPIRSFRNDLFAGYKSDEGMDPELRGQFDLAERAAAAVGVRVLSMKEFEADDALATCAIRFAPEVEQVRIFTPDKDLGQCLRGDSIVQVDAIRKNVITEKSMRERRGVAPESIPDLLALIGDDADGIPGLPGFGEKTAGALLGHFVHLEQIPRLPLSWPKSVRGAPRLADTLDKNRADALLYRTLATLRLDAPAPAKLDDYRFAGIPREPFLQICEELGVTELRVRPTRWRE